MAPSTAIAHQEICEGLLALLKCARKDLVHAAPTSPTRSPVWVGSAGRSLHGPVTPTSRAITIRHARVDIVLRGERPPLGPRLLRLRGWRATHWPPDRIPTSPKRETAANIADLRPSRKLRGPCGASLHPDCAVPRHCTGICCDALAIRHRGVNHPRSTCSFQP